MFWKHVHRSLCLMFEAGHPVQVQSQDCFSPFLEKTRPGRGKCLQPTHFVHTSLLKNGFRFGVLLRDCESLLCLTRTWKSSIFYCIFGTIGVCHRYATLHSEQICKRGFFQKTNGEAGNTRRCITAVVGMSCEHKMVSVCRKVAKIQYFGLWLSRIHIYETRVS